jgi:hypothetical protein
MRAKSAAPATRQSRAHLRLDLLTVAVGAYDLAQHAARDIVCKNEVSGRRRGVGSEWSGQKQPSARVGRGSRWRNRKDIVAP